MDSKTVKLNFLTLGELENEPISKKKWSVPLNSKNISKYYCFFCTLDQINAGLVNRRDFFKKH